MNEKILSITEVHDRGEDGYMGGYEIVTTKQTIQLLIVEDQQCCENAGYIMTNDNLQDFVGADLLDVKQVGTALDIKEVMSAMWGTDADEYRKEDIEKWSDTMFINLETSKGTMQFVAYNEQNGYYGHEVLIQSKQLSITTVI